MTNRGMKDFTIGDLDYGSNKEPADYDANVNAYLTRSETRKGYVEPRRDSKKLKQVLQQPPISPVVDGMLRDLQKRIDQQNALDLQRVQPVQLTPQQIELKKGLSSGIGTVILDALKK